jgi:hypothetical protein
MKKMSTLFVKDPTNLGKVTDQVDPNNAWALTEGKATRKFDGTSCAIIAGILYKRYDAKKGKTPPADAIPCQEADPHSGHHPHWAPCMAFTDKFHQEAYDQLEVKLDGTYELCGPKVQKNPEGFPTHVLVRHGSVEVPRPESMDFESVRSWVLSMPFEGIVFHHEDGRMCKIRRKDFGGGS